VLRGRIPEASRAALGETRSARCTMSKPDPAGAAKPKSDHHEEQRRRHLDQLLDEALGESFPASDVPSVANPELDRHGKSHD
jgi:hypothetical protein